MKIRVLNRARHHIIQNVKSIITPSKYHHYFIQHVITSSKYRDHPYPKCHHVIQKSRSSKSNMSRSHKKSRHPKCQDAQNVRKRPPKQKFKCQFSSLSRTKRRASVSSRSHGASERNSCQCARRMFCLQEIRACQTSRKILKKY